MNDPRIVLNTLADHFLSSTCRNEMNGIRDWITNLISELDRYLARVTVCTHHNYVIPEFGLHWWISVDWLAGFRKRQLERGLRERSS